MPPTVPDAWIALAHALADQARSHTLPRFRTRLTVDDKCPGDFDPVTEADRAAEQSMRALLQAELPDHGIIGEEHGTRASDGPWTWVLDPVDGTRAFIAGLPTWTTLIGLLHEGRPVFGLIDGPVTDDRWVSHGDALGVRPCAGLDHAILTTTTPEMFSTPAWSAGWSALACRARLVRYGGDGYAYGLLSRGYLDAVVERDLQLYDVAAVIPVVRAAGGVITGWDGGDALRGHVVAAGDVRVHAQILEVLSVTGALRGL